MGQKNKKNTYQRETNVSTKVSADKVKSKVNGGVFIYTGAISVSELAKSLNVTPECINISPVPNAIKYNTKSIGIKNTTCHVNGTC